MRVKDVKVKVERNLPASSEELSKDRKNKGTILSRAAKGKRKDGPAKGDKGLYASYHNCGDASSDTSGDTTEQSDVRQDLQFVED